MKKKKRWFKDSVIIITFLGICGYLAYTHFSGAQPQNIGSLIQQVLLSFLSYVGFFSICEAKGWYVFVPNFYLNQKDTNQRQLTAQYMAEYFENDIGFITRYNKDRMNYFITQLGLSQDQIDKVRIDIIRLRMKQIRNIDDAKEKMKAIIRCEYSVVNQKNFDAADLTYKEVDYFVNLVDLMFMPPFATEMTEMMTLLITENISLDSFDKIVIPHDSNLLLGFELGKRLSKPIVIMRQNAGKIIRKQKWDGVLESTDRVIVVHDVLVSGSQVQLAINNVPHTCQVVAFFCLLRRKEWDGKRDGLEKKLKIFSLLDVNDSDIKFLKETSSAS